MLRVSIVMPFRNAGATLACAVGSLVAQTVRDWELIAVDDGSTDGSAHRITGDPRFKVIGNQRSPGIVGALNTGCSVSSAEWIVRMDADDISHPERIRMLLEAADREPGWGVIGSRVELTNALGEGMSRYVDWTNSLISPRDISASRFIENPLVHPSAMIRRDLAVYDDVQWAEDHDLWLRLLVRGIVIGKVPEILLQWRDSPRRLTRTARAYGEEARTRMRAHHLARLDAISEHGVAIAGAGPIGKSLGRALRAEGVTLHGFFEVNPRRIGERIHGAKVVSSGELGRQWRDAVLLSAVGVPGGRDRVRQLALASGYREGEDFWCVC